MHLFPAPRHGRVAWRPLAMALALVGAYAASARPLLAQSPTTGRTPTSIQGPGLAALQDSLQATRDTTFLRHLEASPALQGDGPRNRIARGLVAMRLYDLTADPVDAHHARDDFEAARHIDPNNAWAHYGVGLSLAHGPELRSPTHHTIVIGAAFSRALGLDARSRAQRALRHALEIDPSLPGAARVLAEVATESGDQDALRQARAALTATLDHHPGAVAGWRALSHVALALGDDAAATRAAREAVSRGGPDARGANYDLARALFATPGEEEAGAAAYFAGVDHLDDQLADRYFDDLAEIVTEREQELWETADLAGKRRWLHHIWEVRAALGGVTVAQRIADHYRRLAVARERYPRQVHWGAPPLNALSYKRFSDRFDDRGVIYIRHGEPLHVVQTLSAGINENESWVYRWPDGTTHMLNFRKYGWIRDGGYPDYVLMYNLPCDPDYIADRAPYEPLIGKLSLGCNPDGSLDVSAQLRRYAYAALATDSDHPDFVRELPFAYDIFAFRGDSGRTDLTASVSVPVSEIEPARTAGGGAGYDLSLSLIVVDTLFDHVSRKDTVVRHDFAQPLPPTGRVQAWLTSAVPPSDYAVQRIIVREAADPAHGQLYGGPVAIPDFTGDTLMISDLVLAAPDRPGTWRRGDVQLALMPTGEFPGGAFRVFYELYHLTPEATYRTEIVVDRKGGGLFRAIGRLFGGGPAVRLRFETQAPAGAEVVPELRRVATQLTAGEYRIRIRVTDMATGAHVERVRQFRVTTEG